MTRCAVATRARAAGCWLMGPNTLGMYVPGRGLLGSIAPSFCRPGRLAVIARSGTLTLAMARQLSAAGIGQSLAAHIGGDTVVGRNPDEYLTRARQSRRHRRGALLRRDRRRQGICARARPARGFRKPVVAMVIGRHAPAEKRMGHAGALVGSAREGAEAKLAALAAAGCRTATGPVQVIAIAQELGL